MKVLIVGSGGAGLSVQRILEAVGKLSKEGKEEIQVVNIIPPGFLGVTSDIIEHTIDVAYRPIEELPPSNFNEERYTDFEPKEMDYNDRFLKERTCPTFKESLHKGKNKRYKNKNKNKKRR